NCASSLGPTIAPPLLTVLMISFGWRWMFVSMGLLGIVVAIVWYAVYREVEEMALSPGEAHHLTEGEEEPPPAQHVTLAEWGQLFGFRVTWGLILGFFGNPAPHVDPHHWLRGRHPLCLRSGGQHRRGLGYGQTDGRWVLADQFAQAADHRRPCGNG